MNNLGYLLLMQGEHARAIETCREAARRFDELGMRDEGAGAAANVASGASDWTTRRVRSTRSSGAWPRTPSSASTTASRTAWMSWPRWPFVVVRREGELLVAAAESLRAGTGAGAPPLEQALHEETEAELRGSLDPEDLEAARAEGGAADPTRMVEIASELVGHGMPRVAKPS